jgi:glycosyltransferase involved in cell wall biosynthesis
MQDLMTRVDCIVVPSIWWENAPLVIQEAFMAGIPVICSNIGGMAEKVTDRVNGLHFTVGDHFDLLDRILELAESPELYARLVQGIPSIYSDRQMSSDLNEIYNQLLANNDARVVSCRSGL